MTQISTDGAANTSPDPSQGTSSVAKPGTAPLSEVPQQRDVKGPASRIRSQAPHGKLDVTRPNNPSTAREQIFWEYENVESRNYEYTLRAARWDALASWLRVIVTLTAGISALSVFADSKVIAAVFAAITALVAAVNAGFNPPDKAKAYRNTARAYGHLERPLAELLYVLDTAQTTEYVPQSGYNPKTGMTYDAGYYRTTEVEISPETLSAVWADFLKRREQIESIDESAPALVLRRDKSHRDRTGNDGADNDEEDR